MGMHDKCLDRAAVTPQFLPGLPRMPFCSGNAAVKELEPLTPTSPSSAASPVSQSSPKRARILEEAVEVMDVDVDVEEEMRGSPRSNGRRPTWGQTSPTKDAAGPVVRQGPGLGRAQGQGLMNERAQRDRSGAALAPRP